jgi:hypothetical protein
MMGIRKKYRIAGGKIFKPYGTPYIGSSGRNLTRRGQIWAEGRVGGFASVMPLCFPRKAKGHQPPMCFFYQEDSQSVKTYCI